MTQEQKNLNKQAEEAGIQLTLLGQNVESQLFGKDESEIKMEEFAIECYKIAAEEGSFFGKIQVAYFRPSLYKLTEADKMEIQQRGLSSTASPEDLRNLGLCYHYDLISCPNGFFYNINEDKDLILKAANQEDAFALHFLTENYPSLDDEILKKAADNGSITAIKMILSLNEDLTPDETNKYTEMLLTLKNKRDLQIKNAPTMINLMKKQMQLAFFTLIACAIDIPTEVLVIIESDKRTLSSGNRPTHNLIESLSEFFLASTADQASPQTAHTTTKNPRPSS